MTGRGMAVVIVSQQWLGPCGYVDTMMPDGFAVGRALINNFKKGVIGDHGSWRSI